MEMSDVAEIIAQEAQRLQTKTFKRDLLGGVQSAKGFNPPPPHSKY